MSGLPCFSFSQVFCSSTFCAVKFWMVAYIFLMALILGQYAIHNHVALWELTLEEKADKKA